MGCLNSGTVMAQGETIDYNGGLFPLLENPQNEYPILVGVINSPKSLFSRNSFSDNNVTVTSSLDGDVYGALNTTGKVDTNTVNITSGIIGGRVSGGWSYDDDATNNTVNISNATVRGIVSGGWVYRSSGMNAVAIEGNTVNIGSGAYIQNNIYGGYAGGTGGAKNNHVVITDGLMSAGVTFIAGGYGALSGLDVTENTVTITGGTISSSNTSIYGGKGNGTTDVYKNDVDISGGTVRGNIYGGQLVQGSGPVYTNTVTISGGTIIANVYGGQSGGSGAVTRNEVTLGGGPTVATITGNIYGGHSNSGSATGNIVTIKDDVTFGTGTNIYGGSRSSGSGNIFTSNILNINNQFGGKVNSVQNFEKINFGYSGDANIGTLDTTVRGNSATGIIVDAGTYTNSITLNGSITGSGSVTKTGGGTLTLTQASQFAGLNLEDGTVAFDSAGQLRMSNNQAIKFTGDATLQFDGSLTLNEKIVIEPGYTGTFAVINDYTAVLGGSIMGGAGKLLKTEDGTLIVAANNPAPIGTIEIDAGTLQIGNGGRTGSLFAIDDTITVNTGAALAYNRSDGYIEDQLITGGGKVVLKGGWLELDNTANDFTGGTEIESGILYINSQSYNKANDNTTKAGYITFMGTPSDRKTVFVATPAGTTLTNSFRTASGTGANNIVDLTGSRGLTIKNIDIADDGGAFFVAGGTAMTVKAGDLVLENNKANGVWNDLFVEVGGTFNLEAGDGATDRGGRIDFKSGFDSDGSGILNVKSVAQTTRGRVFLINDGRENTFKMGTTNVSGTVANRIVLNLLRIDHDTDARVSLHNTNAFNMTGGGKEAWGSALLAGGGIIKAGDEFMKNGSIRITNGVLLSPDEWLLPLGAERLTSTMTLQADTIVLADFAMQYSGSPKGGKTQNPLTTETVGGTTVYVSNNTLLSLISDNPVSISGGTIILTGLDKDFEQGDYLIIRSTNGINALGGGGFEDPNDYLKLRMDGFDINPNKNSLRGSYSFVLGGDPTGTGDIGAGEENVWLTTSLNSLTMEWQEEWLSDIWRSGDHFNSLQKGSYGEHENSFMSGDLVYISAKKQQNIELPGGQFGNIRVSGLVVGMDMHLKDEPDSTPGKFGDRDITIRGEGGITADADSAFGFYITGDADTEERLFPTGQLQKYGAGTLSFQNAGGNNFMDGIEIHGGTIAFTQGNQLGDGGKGITFKDDATLLFQGAKDTIDNKIIFGGADNAKINVKGGTELTYSGTVADGSGKTLEKTGTGTLKLDSVTGFEGTTKVSGGTLTLANKNALALSNGIIGSGATLDVLRDKGDTVYMGGLELQGGSILKIQLYPDEGVGPSVKTPLALEIADAGGTIAPGAALVADFGGKGLAPGAQTRFNLFNTDGLQQFDNDLVFVNILGRIIFEERNEDDILYLMLEGKPYSSIDTDKLRPNARPIPNVIDEYQQDGSRNPLTDAFGNIQDDDALAYAFNILPGDVFTAGQMAATDLRKSFNGLLPTFQNMHGEYVTPMSDSYRGQCSDTRKSCTSYWATPTGRWMERSAKGDGFYGYDLGNAGVAVGVTRHIDRRNHIGLALGYDYANLNMQWLTQRDSLSAINLALYGGYVDPCQFFDYQIGYGKNFHDTKRVISFNAAPSLDFYAAPTTSYDDNLLSCSLMYGRRYGAFLPSVGLEYIQVWTPAFAESGSTGAELRGFRGGYSSLELPIGFRLNKTWRHGSTDLTPELRAFWVSQAGDRSSHLMTAFTAGGSEFLVDSGDYGWQHLRVGTGVTTRYNRNWSSSLNYDAALYDGSTRQTASLAVTAKF